MSRRVSATKPAGHRHSLRVEGRTPRAKRSLSPSKPPPPATLDGTGQWALPAEWEGARLFLALWLFRAVNSVLVTTYFHPDEHWQSLEVAHVAVFGYGALCWETLEEIRGFSFPALFTPVYGLLQLTGLDAVRPLFLYVPKVTVCALIAAGGDYATYCLGKRACGSSTAAYALACSVLSWFNFYCVVRPLSNPIESTLCTAALVLWPIWGQLSVGDVVEVDRAKAVGDGGRATIVAADSGKFAVKYAVGAREKALGAEALTLIEPVPASAAPVYAAGLSARQLALLLAAVAVIMRPTCLTLWLCLGLHQFFALPWAEKPPLVLEAVAIGLSVLGLSAVLDCWWYGHWVSHRRYRWHLGCILLKMTVSLRNRCCRSSTSWGSTCWRRARSATASTRGTGTPAAPRRSSSAASPCRCSPRCSTCCAAVPPPARATAAGCCSAPRSSSGSTARRPTRSTASSCPPSR